MKYNWGIVGTGWIAHEMGQALKNLNGTIYGVCSGKIVNAQKFADEFNVEHIYADTKAMFADENIDIVYIATPHNSHYKIMKETLLQGKHVFCEKAITVNEKQLEECYTIAEEKNLVICDGTTILHMPLYKKLRKIVADGVLGKVKMVQVNFGSCKEYDVNNRFFSKELAGGALLDIGVYAVSFARFFMRSKADVVLTTANYFETGVDETSGIILKNPEGEMAVIALTMRAKQPKRGIVACEHGYIEINEYPRAAEAEIVYTADGRREKISAGESKKALEYEITDMENYVDTKGGRENLQIVRDVMATLTAIRNQWGMKYEFE